MDFKRVTAATALIASVGGGGAVAADRAIDPYTDVESHLEVRLGEAQDRVRIAKDRPEIVLERWGGEESLTVKKSGTFQAGKRGWFSKQMVWEGEQSVIVEPLRNDTGGILPRARAQEATSTEEGFKIDILLDTKPDTNVFTLELEGWEDLDFFYQPELTPEEIAEGAHRPENVIGSYAVYHKWKANHEVGRTNYETGKLYHIYRPKVIDADGNEVWGELSYATGTLSVIVPQAFLDSATYPVRVDPSFGYTTVGGSSSSINDDFVYSNAFSLTESGTTTSISYYIDGSGTEDYRGGIYTGGFPLTKEAQAEVTTNVSSDSWQTESLESSYAVSAGTYYIVIRGADGAAYFYDTGNTQYYTDNSPVTTYSNGNDLPASIPSEFSRDRQMTFYATYTVSDPDITYIDSTTADGSGAAISCTKPTGTADGDFVVAVINSNGPQTISDNNGGTPFTQKDSDSYNGPSAGLEVWYRAAGASEPASYSFTHGSSDRWAINCLTYRGVDTSAPFDIDPTFNSGTDATPTTNVATTTNDGAKLLAVAGIDSNSITFSSHPAGYQTREDETGQQGITTSDDDKSTAGAVSAASWTISSGNGWGTYLFALKPAAEVSDTCTPPASGDWNVDAADNCVVSSNTYITGDLNLMELSGAGTFYVTAGATLSVGGGQINSTSTDIHACGTCTIELGDG